MSDKRKLLLSTDDCTIRRNEIAEEQEQIFALAATEGRDLTEDEDQHVNDLNTEVERIAKREKTLAAVRANRERPATPVAVIPPVGDLDGGFPAKETGNDPSAVTPKTIIPATARRYRRLQAFKSDEAAFRSGQWMRAAFLGHDRARQFCRDHGIPIGAVQTTGVNTASGYLVPQEFDTAIIDLREARGVFRRYANVRPMASDSMVIPVRNSGLTAYYVGETDSITASDKGWGQAELTARKVGVLSRYSSDLSEDAIISIADDLAAEIAYAFADAEDNAGFLGDGTSTYGGHFGIFPKIDDGNHAGGLYTAASGNTSFGELDLADFEGAYGALPMYARPGAAWFFSPEGWAASGMNLLNATGGTTAMNLAGTPTPTLFGLPVVLSDVLNSTLTAQASTVIALVGNLRLAAILGDRRGTEVRVDSSRYLEFDQLAILGTARFALSLHSLGDGTNPGPIIGIKTPAS